MKADVHIALMARAPQPGRAKTRLIPRLGAQGAADLHARLVERACRAMAATGLPATLWCAPDTRHPFFTECAKKFGVALRAQPEGDLGARMAHVFAVADGPVLLMGSDCPTIEADLLLRCAGEFSRGARAIFLPAEDGGYGLVGLAAPIPGIFRDMQWGTDGVMAATRARLRASGIDAVEPAIVWDVDRPEDVDRFLALVANG
ncbi:MAG: TIGR04282 family arsenosugar biosynthesis glycosyltransferase [Beijerinckiaceae bacterium]